jgi:hypothetical protein
MSEDRPAAPPPAVAPAQAPAWPLDTKDQQPVLVGLSSSDAILRHREIFRTNLARTELKPEWIARWKSVDTPCVLVVVFGSWCGDTHRQLPDLLALMREPNPFVDVRLVGVRRDKQAEPTAWPKGVAVPAVEKVPTFWVYAQQPGGSYRLAGSIVETPPVKGQRMAEALLVLLEKARLL